MSIKSSLRWSDSSTLVPSSSSSSRELSPLIRPTGPRLPCERCKDTKIWEHLNGKSFLRTTQWKRPYLEPAVDSQEKYSSLRCPVCHVIEIVVSHAPQSLAVARRDDIQVIGESTYTANTVEISVGKEPLAQIRLEKPRERMRRMIRKNHLRYGGDLASLVSIKDSFLTPFPTTSQPTSITFIDVNNNCLISGNSNMNYGALSYVWGDSTAGFLQTTKSNEKYLRIPGSLLTNWHELPHTISDAITVVRSLQIPYLWVDALCIVQDDKKDKDRYISNMGKIYSQATCTIIALAGESSNAGIPGCGRVPVAERHSSLSSRLPLVDRRVLISEFPSLELQLSTSKYGKRAWTFQEHVLSKRCIYFTNFGWQLDDTVEAGLFHRGPSPEPSKFEAYCSIITQYSGRQLSYKTDYLNAVTGILGTLEQQSDEWFISGCPLSNFIVSLLWIRVDSLSPVRNPWFSSWSWAGWTNPVSFAFASSLWEKMTPTASNGQDLNSIFYSTSSGRRVDCPANQKGERCTTIRECTFNPQYLKCFQEISYHESTCGFSTALNLPVPLPTLKLRAKTYHVSKFYNQDPFRNHEIRHFCGQYNQFFSGTLISYQPGPYKLPIPAGVLFDTAIPSEIERCRFISFGSFDAIKDHPQFRFFYRNADGAVPETVMLVRFSENYRYVERLGIGCIWNGLEEFDWEDLILV